MSDNIIDQLIKHTESSDSPLLKLLIEQINQSKNPAGVEEGRPVRNEKGGPVDYLFENANLNDVSVRAYIQ